MGFIKEMKKMNKIELRALKYENPPTLIGQLKKVEEEDAEFQRAVIKDDIDNALEEFYDKIESSLNALRMMGVSLEAIVAAQEKHFKKLEARGWKFE